MEGLERRIQNLEAATGGDGGCDRCKGLLLVVRNAITGEFHWARWSGERLDGVELHERAAETRCPKCGRRLVPDEGAEIRIGGRPPPS